jgi:hypothetical protein
MGPLISILKEYLPNQLLQPPNPKIENCSKKQNRVFRGPPPTIGGKPTSAMLQETLEPIMLFLGFPWFSTL